MPNHLSHLSSASTCSAATQFSSWKNKLRSIFRRVSKNPDLTEESLEEYKRQIASADAAKKTTYRTSPYYKGLTDSHLYISRIRRSGQSPSRESHATTAATASSFSTVIIKIQKWSYSCFRGKRSSSDSAPDEAATEKASAPRPPDPVAAPPLSPSPRRRSYSPSFSGANSRVSASPVKAVAEVGMESVNSVVFKETTEVRREGELNRISGGKPMRERIEIVPKSVTVSTKDNVCKDESTTVSATTTATAMVMEIETMKEKEFVLGARYRPKALKDFICNRDKAERLQNLVSRGECGHFIFEGPPGVGKKTMVLAFLREAFGPENIETREELKEFSLKGESVASVKVKVKISAQHIEVNLSELHGYEKHIIMALLEEANSTTNECDVANCRVLVLSEADKLSADSQLYIRWIVERYKSCGKILFCCSDVSKLQPIRSLCTLIQLLPPSNDEIIEVLEYISMQEGIELPRTLAERITKNSKQNLRQAIRSFEASWQSNYPFNENQVIMTGWEDDIANIARNIIKEQSPKQLYIIRGKLQNLIEHNVSPEFIFSTLVEELKKHFDDQFNSKIDALYLEYKWDNRFPLEDESLREELGKRRNEPGRKNVHHFMRIEEFTAKFMSFYKPNVKKNNEGSD